MILEELKNKVIDTFDKWVREVTLDIRSIKLDVEMMKIIEGYFEDYEESQKYTGENKHKFNHILGLKNIKPLAVKITAEEDDYIKIGKYYYEKVYWGENHENEPNKSRPLKNNIMKKNDENLYFNSYNEKNHNKFSIRYNDDRLCLEEQKIDIGKDNFFWYYFDVKYIKKTCEECSGSGKVCHTAHCNTITTNCGLCNGSGKRFIIKETIIDKIINKLRIKKLNRGVANGINYNSTK